MYKLIWDEHGSFNDHRDKDLKDAFQYIQELAKTGKLSIWIDVVKLVASVGELLELTRVVRLVGTGDSDVNLDISVEPAVM